MTEALTREARLRAEHAARYPDLPPGEWRSARELAREVLQRGWYRDQAGSPMADRPLPETHFEFRGPSTPPEERPGGRSRETDVSVAGAAADLRSEQERLTARLDAAQQGIAEAEVLRKRADELEHQAEELRRKGADPIMPERS